MARVVLAEQAQRDLDELDRPTGDGPPLPKPDASGFVPAVEYARAALARKLIRDRRRAGLTQADLASRAGIRAELLARIEQGKSVPNQAIFGKIHRALEKAERRGRASGARDDRTAAAK